MPPGFTEKGRLCGRAVFGAAQTYGPIPPRLDVREAHCVPEGQAENSPTFQRWEPQIRHCMSPEGTAEWVHDTFPQHRDFQWQVKYGAFGVSVSLLDKTVQYIKSQETHHRKMTFQEEFLVSLKKHRIDYDELFLWE